ncbi:GNAT family N-acetyltransferase [Streptomyces sp. NPDC093707]|uniref:GNAT family N-acetyltransferase n=1 Tax=Streptomyces sp. NPDC093707 TaxID=3154984 RepID=UPI00344B1BC7
MSSASSPAHADVLTGRLVLRTWTLGEAGAVLDGARSSHWADDFPAEGDRVVAGLLDQHPAWLGAYGHRLIIERESALVVGSIGLFWPPDEGLLGNPSRAPSPWPPSTAPGAPARPGPRPALLLSGPAGSLNSQGAHTNLTQKRIFIDHA